MTDNAFGRGFVAALMIVACLGGLSVVPAFAQAPSLGEVARKEQERRKTAKKPTKVYTNDDLPESAKRPPAGEQPQGAQPTGPAAPSGSVAPSGGESKVQTPAAPQDEQKDETYWRKRIAAARENLRRNEMFAEALQTRINSLSADFVSRDDPYQRAKLGEDRDKALAELARVQKEIADGKQLIEDIEEEARKAGVPPGWLR